MKEKIWGIIGVIAFFAVVFLVMQGCHSSEQKRHDAIVQEGYNSGYYDGLEDGNKEGYNDGYSDGYDDGVDDE